MSGNISLLVGILFGIGVYLILHRNLLRILFGVILLSNAVNIFLLSMSQSPQGKAVPIIEPGSGPAVDPMPQAMILTAIVIGFALTAYLIVLTFFLYHHYQTLDLEEIYSRNEEASS